MQFQMHRCLNFGPCCYLCAFLVNRRDIQGTGWRISNITGWLIDWMVFYAAFNSISVISPWQLTLFMLSWVTPVLGWALKCLAQGHSHEKTQRIHCGLNPGPLDYESNPLQHNPNFQHQGFPFLSPSRPFLRILSPKVRKRLKIRGCILHFIWRRSFSC